MDQREELSHSDDRLEAFDTPAQRDAPSSDKPSGLTAALRKARRENADRADIVDDLRSAEIARLEILRDHLAPVFSEIPSDCDAFDPGLTAGERPRLFIDVVAFVEMGRDRRRYRFIQDTRAGRVILADSERLETMVRAVTDYIARRLVEREKALASATATQIGGDRATAVAVPHAAAPSRARPGWLRVLARAFLFFVEIVGSAVVFAAIGAGAIWAWHSYGR